MSTSRIAVVVFTRNRVREVVTTVARLFELPEAPPILIADDASEDHTVSLLANLFPSVRIVQGATRVGVPACNRAAAWAASDYHADYLAFTDDDLCWEAGALDRAVQMLDTHPRIAILAAHVSMDGGDEAEPACAALQASPLTDDALPGPLLTRYQPGACVIRTAVFGMLGGYESRLRDAGADELLALDVLAAGHAIVYCEALRARREPSASPDRATRRALAALQARNAAWVAWLRLPQWFAWWATLRALAVFAGTFALHREAWPLIDGIGWAWRNRRRVPATVHTMRRQVVAAERRRAALSAAATAASHHEDLRA